jgi:hypothetical protein
VEAVIGKAASAQNGSRGDAGQCPFSGIECSTRCSFEETLS